jgi:hypothetical protein
MVEIIKDRVTFENLNFSASSNNLNPQITVRTVSESGSSTTDTIAAPPTLAGYALTTGLDQEVFATGEVTLLSANSFSISQSNSSNTGSTFWDSDNPTTENLKLLSGSNPIGSEISLTLDNASERIAIAIEKVNSIKSNLLPGYRSQFDFGEFDSSSYLDSLNMTKSKFMEPNIIINQSQKTAKMIIADEIQNLLAKVGNAAANDVYELIKST